MSSLEMEIRAARRPLPRQIDGSAWTTPAPPQSENSSPSSALSGVSSYDSTLRSMSTTSSPLSSLGVGSSYRSQPHSHATVASPFTAPRNRYDTSDEPSWYRSSPSLGTANRFGTSDHASASAFRRPPLPVHASRLASESVRSAKDTSLAAQVRAPSPNQTMPRSLPESRANARSPTSQRFNEHRVDDASTRYRLEPSNRSSQPLHSPDRSSDASSLARDRDGRDSPRFLSPFRSSNYRRVDSRPRTANSERSPRSSVGSLEVKREAAPESENQRITSAHDLNTGSNRHPSQDSVSDTQSEGDRSPIPRTPVRSRHQRLSTATSSDQQSSVDVSSRSSMREQREALYAFRKRMRDVFGRVDEMVDAHRDCFKSDPTTGIPIFNRGLVQEAKDLADEVFQELANLRTSFESLTDGFSRLEAEEARSHDARKIERRQKRSSGQDRRQNSASCPHQRTGRDNQSESDDDDHRHQPRPKEDEESDSSSTASRRIGSPPRRRSFLSSNQHENSDTEEKNDEHHRDSPHRTGDSSIDESFASTVTSWEATHGRLSSDSWSADSPLRSNSTTSTTATPSRPDNVFADFDKRMEEIRSSLNSIAGSARHRARDRSPAIQRTSSSGNGRQISASPITFSSRNREGASSSSSTREDRLKSLMEQLQLPHETPTSP